MYILDALKSQREIPLSLEGITSFLETEMNQTEKVDDYFARKFKDSKELVVIGFESIQPVKLKIHHRYQMADMSSSLKMNNDILHPLLISYNITNNQYRKIYGTKDGVPFKGDSRGSFSDYYLSRKVLDSSLPSLLELNISEQVENRKLKADITREFYKYFNKEAKKQVGGKEAGVELFVDFNSLFDLANCSDTEIKYFLESVIDEYGMSVPYSYEEVKEKRRANALLYLLESIDFQAEQMYKITDLETKNLTDILSHEVPLPFEVPTAEKSILGNVRIQELNKNDDLPKATFFEMFLLRILVLSINKQGKLSNSGFHLLLKNENDKALSIEKTMQVTGDAYGNMSISSIDINNVKKIHLFKQRIMESYALFFSSKLQEQDAERMFYAKYYSVKDSFFFSQQKEREMIERKMKKRAYNDIGKSLKDGAFTNVDLRIMAYEKKMNKSITYFDLLDLMFVITALRGVKNSTLERLSFMNKQLKANDLSKQENLTKEEYFFLLGGTAGMVIRQSRNSSSLLKAVLKQNRIPDILQTINKRIESGIDEIEYLPMVSNWMNVLVSQLSLFENKKLMISEEKFAFVAGVLSESKNKKQEDVPNEKE